MLLVWLVIAAALLAPVLFIVQPVLFVFRDKGIPAVSPENLKAHVRALSVEFHPRDMDHPENMERAANYIDSVFRRNLANVSEERYRAYGREYRNILARFGPDTAEHVLIGAHYDSPMRSPGADDNASGVAGLLEISHLLSSADLKRKVILEAFTQEEGFYGSNKMGSFICAEKIRISGAPLRAVIVLEMIGCYIDEKGSQQYPSGLMSLLYPSRGNFIAVAGRLSDWRLTRRVKRSMKAATGLPVWSVNSPFPGVEMSDHSSFWKNGFNAVMVTDTAFLRNERYHCAEDAWETLDYPRMAEATRAVYAAAVSIAND